LIALTGYGQPADRERARDAGFDHHLTKPADPDELLGLIGRWMKSRSAGRDAGEGARRAAPRGDA
ncbi:MAG: hybrid sensor histidine kinase/response regulator, partial [Caldimonas sp.]